MLSLEDIFGGGAFGHGKRSQGGDLQATEREREREREREIERGFCGDFSRVTFLRGENFG